MVSLHLFKNIGEADHGGTVRALPNLTPSPIGAKVVALLRLLSKPTS
jgi:hypothetical protein